MKWEDYVEYDETSPSCLRRTVDVYSGRNYAMLSAQAGDVAGWVTEFDKSDDYYVFKVGRASETVHRIVWQLCKKESIPPGMEVDHIDGNTLNNRIENLRCVPRQLNSRNHKKRSHNTSGVCGVRKTVNTIKGVAYEYWTAQWSGLAGERRSKSFSFNKYGEGQAFQLACEYRSNMINALNEQGAGYTERHGV